MSLPRNQWLNSERWSCCGSLFGRGWEEGACRNLTIRCLGNPLQKRDRGVLFAFHEPIQRHATDTSSLGDLGNAATGFLSVCDEGMFHRNRL